MTSFFLMTPVKYRRISSKFSSGRKHPVLGYTRPHYGVDYAAASGTPIYAAGEGRISFAGIKGGYGKAVIVEHDYGLKTVYGHLNSYNVKAGDKISRGDIIGVQGTTGRSTGHHLHYEIIKGRQRYSPLEFIKVGSNLY